jgi:NADH:ubiquinone oxidoreductase subunit D
LTLEEIAGQRMMFNYIRIGGVQRDPKPEWFDKLKRFTEEFPDRIDEYEAIVTRTLFFSSAPKVSVSSSSSVAQLITVSLVPAFVASGIPLDLRRTKPYSVYPELKFDVITFDKEGDTWDRYMARILEMRESVESSVSASTNSLKARSWAKSRWPVCVSKPVKALLLSNRLAASSVAMSPPLVAKKRSASAGAILHSVI